MNDRIYLIEANEAYAEEVEIFKQEVLICDAGSRDQFAGCMGLEEAETAREWIRSCTLRNDPLTCKMTGADVSSTTYFAIRESDNRLVGVIDLRHHIDHPVLGTWGGHIGYSVKPAERGHGYAKEMLRLNIQNAKKRGISRLLLVCDEENTISERTIVKNGGVFEKKILVDGYYMKRYWISV